ncbi:MAG: hypothetical protein H0W73_03525 [Bacteroidetes bacterium]|nr:hypothetical protein [Bacteroidota bacterium]
MKNIFNLLLIFGLITNLQAQKRESYFPIWTFHHPNSITNGISIGIASGMENTKNTKSNGVRVEIIGAGLLIPLISGPMMRDDSITEKINGINLSFTGTLANCKVNGISVGYVGESIYKVNGISATGCLNYVGISNGLQCAVLVNDNDEMKGMQVAFINNSVTTKGIQIGVFNFSKDLRGIQLGLWNKNGKRSLPIVNWQFKKCTDIEL